MFNRLFGKRIDREVKQRVDLAVRALDDTRDRSYLRSGDTYPRDRHGYDRDEVLADALEAWRVNPLARRIVGMTTQYVIGGGISVEVKAPRTNKFIKSFWDNPLNQMDMRLYEWCDELTRSGELFILLSTDAVGMSYVRALPAVDIQSIETSDNDLEQEQWIIEKPSGGVDTGSLLEGRRWKVYDRDNDVPTQTVILHYTVNRPVGAKFGESDLAPLLRWLSRYAAWLEDRARLNRFRNSFTYWVKAKFTNNAERLERQAELNRNPPNPGSILVTDESETWSVLYPNLASFEAAEDGLALKKMVSVGAGLPLHFLAEPESATRTTAEASGGPTFRHLQQRQIFFLWMIEDIVRAVLRRRRYYDRSVNPDAELEVTGADLSARDNAALASASATVAAAFLPLYERGLVDDSELLRVIYGFAGEVVDIEEILRQAKVNPSWASGQAPPNSGFPPAGLSPAGGPGGPSTGAQDVKPVPDPALPFPEKADTKAEL
jgi:hypothetical protein